MNARSLAQVRWQQDRLGLLMVNDQRDRFFLHGDKLLELFARTDEYLVVKLRHRRPVQAIGSYPGQIMGSLNYEGETTRITLYVGEAFRDIGYNEATGKLRHYLTTQTHVFDRAELEAYRQVIQTMVSQHTVFDDLLRGAEATQLLNSSYVRRQHEVRQ